MPAHRRTGVRAAAFAFSVSRERGRGPMSGMSMIAEDDIKALNAWLAKAGLAGGPGAALVNGFCERAVAVGLPISRALLLIDTLHPVYEGRVVRWGQDPSEPAVQEYGRTGSPGAASDPRLSSPLRFAHPPGPSETGPARAR